MKEPYVVFYLLGGEQLAAYTLRGTFAGECMATRELLAYKHGVRVDDITVKIEWRNDREEV